jgi:uncharacterized protein (UPF0264 family)
VSVRDAAEARLAAGAGADLVDAKDPARGALGALPAPEVRAIVAAVGREALTSAVAGEPQTAPELAAALLSLDDCGLEFIKVALPTGPLGDTETEAALAPCRTPIIAAFFAEDGVDPGLLPRLARAGFAGAMIDTRVKDGRRLPDLIPPSRLGAFVEACRAAGLICGLAGSLAIDDIPALAGLGPDYLGFRGGLCAGADRRGALDPERIARAVQRLAAAARMAEPA